MENQQKGKRENNREEHEQPWKLRENAMLRMIELLQKHPEKISSYLDECAGLIKKPGDGHLTRRSFLLTAGAAALCLEADRYVDGEKRAQAAEHGKSVDTIGRKASYVDTAAEIVPLYMAEFLSVLILHSMGLRAGADVDNEKLLKAFEEHPLDASIKTVIMGPLFEEVLCRLVPHLTLVKFGDDSLNRRMDVGIPVAAAFAVLHNIGYEDDGRGFSFDKFTFDTGMVPLPQFIQGIFMWYLTRTRGIKHAVFAHMLHNTPIALRHS